MFAIGLVALFIVVVMSLAFSLLNLLDTQRRTHAYPRI